MILCIDTAVSSCNIGLISNGKMIDALDGDQAVRASEILHTNISDLLQRNKVSKNELSAIAINGGPGSYTGLRIGASAAKGFCYALKIPLIHIDGLRLMLNGVKKRTSEPFPKYFIPMIDARRDEVFTAVFDKAGNELLAPQAMVLTTDSFKDFDTGICFFFGNGASKAANLISIKEGQFDDFTASSSDFTALVWNKWNEKDFENTITYTPDYLKPVHITSPKLQ